MKIKTALSLSLFLVGLCACASTDMTDTSDSSVFVARVASSDQFEIQSSQLAVRSTDPAIQSFAQQMVGDHTKSGLHLNAVLTAEHEPSPKPMLAPYHARMLADLKVSDNFDCDYLASQLAAHEQAVGMFDAFTVYGDDAHLRKFAVDTLPVLQQHLSLVESILADSGCVGKAKRP